MKKEYFVSCSFGADSTATAIIAIEKGEPISALVYCEIMFDKERSAEVPEHRDFIYNTAIPYFEQRGVKTIVLRAEKTAREWMEARVTKGPRTGKKHGFPLSGRQGWCSIKRDCKLPPLNKFQKEHPGAVYYEGICIDEKRRIKEEKLAQGCYLLVKYGYTQEMARNLCKERGLLSPIYKFTKRGGVLLLSECQRRRVATPAKAPPGTMGRNDEDSDGPGNGEAGKISSFRGVAGH